LSQDQDSLPVNELTPHWSRTKMNRGRTPTSPSPWLPV
jgi:hypothetical protein